jgi:hypothetical protein
MSNHVKKVQGEISDDLHPCRVENMANIASSAARVPSSRIRDLAHIAMQMEGVLKLYFGESNLPTPEFIKRAAYWTNFATFRRAGRGLEADDKLYQHPSISFATSCNISRSIGYINFDKISA